MNLSLESLVAKMTCRRKTKSERELVADINKAFLSFCKARECRDCGYNKGYLNCKIAYITDLLNKYKGE